MKLVDCMLLLLFYCHSLHSPQCLNGGVQVVLATSGSSVKNGLAALLFILDGSVSMLPPDDVDLRRLENYL